MPPVTVTGHGRIIMQGSKNYYVDQKWGKAIGESSSPSNSRRSSREEAGRALYRQKETKPKKLVSSFVEEEKGCLFTGSGESGNSSPKMAFSSIG